MKPLDYVKKYTLGTPNYKIDWNEFIADLSIDFATLLETSKGTQNIKGFEKAASFQDELGRWLVDAINEKLERER